MLAVVSLAGVTAALAWAALGSTGAEPTPTPTGSALIEPSETTPTQEPTTEDVRALDVEPALALVDGRTAFRGRTGACLGGATMERTTDGGRTWASINVPMNSVLDINPQSQAVVTVVGSDDECTPGAWSSNDGGSKWNGPTPTGSAWVRIDNNAPEIRTPSGEVKNPCSGRSPVVVEIEGMSETSGAVLCEEGVIKRSDDGGATWTAVTPIPGAEALAWQDPQSGFLLASNSGLCPAYQLMRTIDGGGTWETGGCLGVEGDAGAQVARPSLDYADLLAGMAVLGEATWTTDDGGYNWLPVRSR